MWTGTPCTTHHTSHWRGSTQSMPRGSSWADQMENNAEKSIKHRGRAVKIRGKTSCQALLCYYYLPPLYISPVNGTTSFSACLVGDNISDLHVAVRGAQPQGFFIRGSVLLTASINLNILPKQIFNTLRQTSIKHFLKRQLLMFHSMTWNLPGPGRKPSSLADSTSSYCSRQMQTDLQQLGGTLATYLRPVLRHCWLHPSPVVLWRERKLTPGKGRWCDLKMTGVWLLSLNRFSCTT